MYGKDSCESQKALILGYYYSISRWKGKLVIELKEDQWDYHSIHCHRNATSDIWRMHDFNYQLPIDLNRDYWEKRYKDHQQVLIAKFTKDKINLRH